jgi:sulfite reductase (ferredoxin)
MKASNALWKERLAGRMPEALAREVEIFETEINLRRQGKVDEKIFAETRLRRGVYGQRYDNGQRHDGKQAQTLAYPQAGTKGPNTLWDAPGMQRIKIPYGGLSPAQLETLAELAEEYSDGIAHVTTRQDFQLHYVHIEDTPALMRRLAAAGITTREACGNSVRNVTACPFAGVCKDETFDVTPYAGALAQFLLGHPDTQDFGRKFKPTFSGCRQHSCGLVAMHDLGMVAVTRSAGGRTERGFEVHVGGGLGAVPYQAKLLEDFVPPEELLPLAQAVSRVFARLGEKKNRARARIKFLVRDLGIDKFRELVREERSRLPPDPRWTESIPRVDAAAEGPKRPPGELPAVERGRPESARYLEWLESNVREQKQAGYAVATVALPLGDITSRQLRALADVVRRFTRDTVRTTVEQNFVVRWVSKADLLDLHRALDAAGLGESGASTIVDIVACPGTDTCKLGIASSRGLAGELRRRLAEKSYLFDEAVRKLHIKVSGCFNSCGQHHVADLGFYGVSRTVNGYKVPHFQVVVGGLWEENAAAYGLSVMAVPSKRIPDVVDRFATRYMRERQGPELFKDFVKRIGKLEIKAMLDDLAALPSHQSDPASYTDWRDPREYTIEDIGVGECAGEVVSHVEFGLTAAERQVFEAQVLLDAGQVESGAALAYKSMLEAAKALIKVEFIDITDDGDRIVEEFRKRYFETQKFFDPFAGGKFAGYFFAAHKRKAQPQTQESALHLIEEARLFIEAAYSCYHRLRGGQ